MVSLTKLHTGALGQHHLLAAQQDALHQVASSLTERTACERLLPLLLSAAAANPRGKPAHTQAGQLDEAIQHTCPGRLTLDSHAESSGRPRPAAAPTIAAASGCDDSRSTHAASRSTSPSSKPPNAWQCATCGFKT